MSLSKFGVVSCAVVACLFWAAAPASAQEVTAAINGHVTDPSGAAIAGAKVVATDTQRGTQWPTVTNGDGAYNLPRIPIGTYNIRVENSGFQTSQQSDVTLVLNQVARLDFQLQVGNYKQTVEVNAAAPILQNQSTELGQVIDARTNTALPLATRNYVQLTLLAAGSVHPNPSSFKGSQTTSSSGRPYVNGNREQTNNFILDGMDNNQVSDNLVGYAPSVDAIQEFNEITQNAPAEFGNFMGAIVSTSIKSGTNQFHGDIFEFFRNDILNANNWNANRIGGARGLTRWNNFGGTLGGPIIHNKLFFFADYQGSRLDFPASAASRAQFTAKERTGDFSELLTASTPKQLYDPFSLVNGQRVPFVNNVIPTSLLSPVALKIVNASANPLPNLPGLVSNYLYQSGSYTNGDQGDARGDWNLSDKHRFFGRYSQSRYDSPSVSTFPFAYNGFSTTPTKNGVVDLTSTLSPSFVNDLRGGVNYVRVNNGTTNNGTLGNFPATIGLPGIPSTILPSMSLGNTFASGIGSAAVYQLFANTVFQYGDTAILSKGNHTMHMGFQGQRQRINTFYSGNNGLAGTFSFDGRYTAGPSPLASGGSKFDGVATGAGEADFLLGLPYDIGEGVNGGTWGQRANIFGVFFQDDWRVTPHLTLNLGLRWELHTPWVEVKNRQANFDLTTGQEYIAGQGSCPYNNCSALYNQYNGITNFQPRIGFAYTPGGGKFVVRGAYTESTYLEGTGTNLRLPINPPFAGEHELDYSKLRTGLPGSTLDQGFLPFAASTGTDPTGATLRVWNPDVRPAVSNQFNFTLQQQLGNSTTIQAGYVGQRTTRLMVPIPYLQKQLLPNGTVGQTAFLTGNPTLLSEIGQVSGTASNGNQSYNSLQVVVQKRLGSGLQYSAAYTWSKCMSNAIGYYGSSGQSASQSAYWQNLYDSAAEWGPCFYDVTHNLTGDIIYDLPFGRGRAFGKNMNRFVDAAVGGWQVSAIGSFHNGFPLTITAGDNSGTGSRGARANCLAPGTVFGEQNSPSGGYQWFDPSPYSATSPGTFGNCGVGTIRGPGLKNVDMSLEKSFSVTEHQRLQVRGDFLNVSNSVILNAPSRGIGSSLGLIQSSQGERNIQLSMKYTF